MYLSCFSFVFREHIEHGREYGKDSDNKVTNSYVQNKIHSYRLPHRIGYDCCENNCKVKNNDNYTHRIKDVEENNWHAGEVSGLLVRM